MFQACPDHDHRCIRTHMLHNFIQTNLRNRCIFVPFGLDPSHCEATCTKCSYGRNSKWHEQKHKTDGEIVGGSSDQQEKKRHRSVAGRVVSRPLHPHRSGFFVNQAIQAVPGNRPPPPPPMCHLFFAMLMEKAVMEKAIAIEKNSNPLNRTFPQHARMKNSKSHCNWKTLANLLKRTFPQQAMMKNSKTHCHWKDTWICVTVRTRSKNWRQIPKAIATPKKYINLRNRPYPQQELMTHSKSHCHSKKILKSAEPSVPTARTHEQFQKPLPVQKKTNMQNRPYPQQQLMNISRSHCHSEKYANLCTYVTVRTHRKNAWAIPEAIATEKITQICVRNRTDTPLELMTNSQSHCHWKKCPNLRNRIHPKQETLTNSQIHCHWKNARICGTVRTQSKKPRQIPKAIASEEMPESAERYVPKARNHGKASHCRFDRMHVHWNGTSHVDNFSHWTVMILLAKYRRIPNGHHNAHGGSLHFCAFCESKAKQDVSR